ncbi:MAG: bifunctional (p)ppGpp synthetase/guanosine-3',5'-bis(diphosphate) 3'-pyrophosphohydrolase [Proteobacteria bacterium]|nr:bifunctional (p)ppGpp synthetase/guanosine-3',5'-bis(diphosphate) 3'-pyrophosphohydrolase [Pseudomonadota bacterium]
MSDLVEKALEFATKCHKGQVDKGGCDYIEHPKRVAAECENDDEKVVALLHDTMEDCGVTAQTLRESGFPDEIIAAVESCTKNKNEDYFDYVRRACDNKIGRVVKMHDLEDNMNILRMASLCSVRHDILERDLRNGECCLLKEKDLYRLNKYLAAYRILQGD